MKLILKKIMIVMCIICILVPYLFSGAALAASKDDQAPLTLERAGNFAANFAINFYENWSSINVEGGKSSSAGGTGEFIWPVPSNGNINSGYGWRLRKGKWEFHCAIDIGGNIGDAIIASESGEIVEVRNQCICNEPNCYCGGWGNTVVIDHKNGMYTRYSHCTTIDVNVGDFVQKGQIIATLGNTGNSEGAHLDFIIATKATVVNGRMTIPDKQMDTVDPTEYISYDNSGTGSTSSTNKTTIRGSIETQYNETSQPDDIVEGTTPYKFSNKSWIGFVYKWSLNMNSTEIITGNDINESYFDNAETLFGESLIKESKYIDTSSLISEGKILPGDILYIENGKGGGEYVLYVGGTKIIFATPPKIEDTAEDPSVEDLKDANKEKVDLSALQYEYIEYYLRKIQANLLHGNENNPDFIMPEYGVTKVYRLKESVANSKTEADTNLIFNGKGYYSYTEYTGVPKEITALPSESLWKWIFSKFLALLEFFVNLILYIVRMQIIGWANLVENLLQTVLLGISGDNQTAGVVDAIFGTNQTSASGGRITVESIFFNKIPILDANFFKLEGLEKDNLVYQLRINLANWYVIIRNASIAVLLIVLIYLGIRMAITTLAEKKAQYKQLLTTWFIAFAVVFCIHFFMYAIFSLNDTFVNICNEIGKSAANDVLDETYGEITNGNAELNMYDSVRSKAYAFSWREGIPSTIIYIYLIYLLIRFSIIYFKRYLTIYILALSGSIMAVKHAIERIGGKKTNTMQKWFKEFAFNVLLQTVHALIYVLFIALAIEVSETSISGFIVALMILNFMLKADKLIMKIFGLDKAGSLADVDQKESWKDLFMKFIPIYAVNKKIITGVGGALFGKRGQVRELIYHIRGKDNYKDAEKDFEQLKFNAIGSVYRNLGTYLPLSKYGKKLAELNKDASYDTNKRLYESIKKAKQLRNQRFTRKLKLGKDLAIGNFMKVASIAAFIEDPTLGIAMYTKGSKTIKKYKDPLRNDDKFLKQFTRSVNDRFNAKYAILLAKRKYNNSLDIYAHNQYEYEEKRKELLDLYNNETDTTIKRELQEQIDTLDREREEAKNKELEILKNRYIDIDRAKGDYKSTKRDANPLTQAVRFGEAAIGATTIDNISRTEKRAAEKNKEKSEKADKKVGDVSKVRNVEIELHKLAEQLKQAQEEYTDEYMQNHQDATKEDVQNTLQADYVAMIKDSKKMNVRSALISEAVNKYMFKNATSTIDDSDVEDVLTDLQKIMTANGKKLKLTSDVKSKVKTELQAQMASEGRTDGYKVKEAVVKIREILGKEGVLNVQHKSKHNMNNLNDSEKAKLKEVTDIQDKMLQKMKEINTYNETGKIKYKEALVNMNKILSALNK